MKIDGLLDAVLPAPWHCPGCGKMTVDELGRPCRPNGGKGLTVRRVIHHDHVEDLIRCAGVSLARRRQVFETAGWGEIHLHLSSLTLARRRFWPAVVCEPCNALDAGLGAREGAYWFSLDVDTLRRLHLERAEVGRIEQRRILVSHWADVQSDHRRHLKVVLGRVANVFEGRSVEPATAAALAEPDLNGWLRRHTYRRAMKLIDRAICPEDVGLSCWR